MKLAPLRTAAFACTLLAGTALTAPSLAQSIGTTSPAVRQTVDENGVSLITGQISMAQASVTIGGSDSGADFRLWLQDGTSYGNIYGWVNSVGSTYTVVYGASSEIFTWNGTSYVEAEARGNSFDGGNYTLADGTIITFGGTPPFNDTVLMISSITKPSGETLTYYYLQGTYVTNPPLVFHHGYRLSSIVSSNGYQLEMAYRSDTLSTSADIPNWQAVNKVTAINTTVEVCVYILSTACTTTNSWPTLQLTWDPATTSWSFTDSLARVSKFTFDSSNRPTAVRYFGSTSDNVNVSYDTNSRVSSITKDGITTTYTYADLAGVRTTTATYPGSVTRIYTFDLSKSAMLSYTNELGRTTGYTYDSSARPTQVTTPEGNYVQSSYDSRGNVTGTLAHAKSGSGLSDVTTSAIYPSSCTNILTCNKPTSTTDARGNTTSYTWDSTHGGIVTATLPAVGGINPQTRYGYTVEQAEFRDPGHTFVAGASTYKLTSISQCQTTSSCSGGSDETKTTIAYAQVGGYSNLRPTSTSTGSGNGTLTATTATSYDNVGNISTIDGPLSGTADTGMYRYDADRERIGVISPDPDGVGSLKNRATRTTYDGHGLVTKVEQGTVNSQSDTDWAAFSSLQETDLSYDSNLRPITRSAASGGSTYAVVQTSYDSLGHVQCIAQRMNPSAFGSLPSDACTLGTTGSYGADRIVKTTYDAAGHVTKTTNAYGTPDQADTVTSTYTNNGLVSTVTDGETNKTTYAYDGFDRRVIIYYPSTTKGSGTSSTTDYDQLAALDANGNATQRRNRANETTYYTYDALNRMTAKTLPNSEPAVTYSYDLLGRLTGASQTGNALSFTYDALGRNLTQVGPQGTMTSTWDLAGHRTQLTWPDSFYVNYDHLVTGEVSAIRENGATSGVGVLATFAYDNLGRRAGLTYGNGASTSYSYDSVSRLTQMAHDLAGTTYDQTLGFSYSPASQITQNTRSNDNYAWGGHGSGSTNYTATGLNQYSAVGSTTPTYDSRGNLTSAGSTTYSYSSENLLTSATGSIALTYDPTMRLYQLSGGTPGTQRFEYDGQDLVAEYNSSNAMLRRFVHGPGTDEPLVWYEGTGTTDRRFLHADERGTIVAVTNSSGSALSINTYDEYGKPGSSNSGRFQYTGQAYIPELGAYYYKARMYASGLGRFMQTDPTGYGDGLNWYSYTGDDPINGSDPTGLTVYHVCWNEFVQDPPGAPPPPSHNSSEGVVVTAAAMPSGHYEQHCTDVTVDDSGVHNGTDTPTQSSGGQPSAPPKPLILASATQKATRRSLTIGLQWPPIQMRPDDQLCAEAKARVAYLMGPTAVVGAAAGIVTYRNLPPGSTLAKGAGAAAALIAGEILADQIDMSLYCSQ